MLLVKMGPCAATGCQPAHPCQFGSSQHQMPVRRKLPENWHGSMAAGALGNAMWQPKVPDVSPGMPAGCLQGVASQTAHLLRKGRGKPAQPDGLCALPTRLWVGRNCCEPPDPPSTMEGPALACWAQVPVPPSIASPSLPGSWAGLKGCRAPQALLFLEEIFPTTAQ